MKMIFSAFFGGGGGGSDDGGGDGLHFIRRIEKASAIDAIPLFIVHHLLRNKYCSLFEFIDFHSYINVFQSKHQKKSLCSFDIYTYSMHEYIFSFGWRLSRASEETVQQSYYRNILWTILMHAI